MKQYLNIMEVGSKMSSPRITTIGQLMAKCYGPQMVNKANAPVISTTTGVYNAIYGAQAFSQLNNEANAFALLPKLPWDKSGWRVISADAGSTATGGVTENGTIPDTIKPTFAEVETKAKQVVHTFDVSYLQEGYVQKGDDALGDMEFLRGYFATLHAKRINEMLLVDGDTLAGNNFESIDRVTASSAYATAVSWTTGDEDIYGIDRSANSWADAVVEHNSGTDRDITDDLIRSTLSTIENNGGRTNIMLTGNDTKYRIFGLYNNQVRYPGVLNQDTLVNIGINGVNTEEGIGVGMRVATIYGIPLFSSQAVQKDTISRIYLLDTTENESTGVPRLYMKMLYPTLYFESGMSANMPDPFAINRTGTQGLYFTAGELICTFFKAQGSIRDLK